MLLKLLDSQEFLGRSDSHSYSPTWAFTYIPVHSSATEELATFRTLSSPARRTFACFLHSWSRRRRKICGCDWWIYENRQCSERNATSWHSNCGMLRGAAWPSRRRWNSGPSSSCRAFHRRISGIVAILLPCSFGSDWPAGIRNGRARNFRKTPRECPRFGSVPVRSIEWGTSLSLGQTSPRTCWGRCLGHRVSKQRNSR